MQIHIHIHHHAKLDDELQKSLNLLHKKIDLIMNKQEQFDAALATLNEATNDIAADLELLKKQIEDGTITDESLAKLKTNADYLKQLGASTENPVPEPPAGEGEGTGGGTGSGEGTGEGEGTNNG